MASRRRRIGALKDLFPLLTGSVIMLGIKPAEFDLTVSSAFLLNG